jgi:hypothetical protein
MQELFTEDNAETINLVAISFGETFLQPGDEIILSTIKYLEIIKFYLILIFLYNFSNSSLVKSVVCIIRS